MGYKINYNNSALSMKQIVEVEHEQGNRGFAFLLCMIIICALVFTAKATDFDFYRLLPGDKDVTKSAVTSFLNNISDGLGFEDAITAFCTEILDGVQLE